MPLVPRGHRKRDGGQGQYEAEHAEDIEDVAADDVADREAAFATGLDEPAGPKTWSMNNSVDSQRPSRPSNRSPQRASPATNNTTFIPESRDRRRGSGARQYMQ